MRVALVVNTASGSASAELTPGAIRARIEATGISVVPEPTPDAALPARLASAADLPGIDAVVVAGGDGTIGCAAATLVGRDIALALLPLGTMNLLAKDLGIPLDLDGAVACLVANRQTRIDVGEVNGSVFLINSVLGMAARVARHREAQRHGFSPRALLRWAFGMVRHLGRYPRLTVTGTVDGQRRQLRFRLLAVVVGDYVTRPGEGLLRAPLDGGRLTLYVIRKLSLRRGLRLALGFAIGDWRQLPEVERAEIGDLTIASQRRALRVMNDGEVRLLASPLHYRIRPRALAVIVPEERP